jgi:hypothetical protein
MVQKSHIKMIRTSAPVAVKVTRQTHMEMKLWGKGTSKIVPSPIPETAIPLANPRFFSNQ